MQPDAVPASLLNYIPTKEQIRGFYAAVWLKMSSPVCDNTTGFVFKLTLPIFGVRLIDAP